LVCAAQALGLRPWLAALPLRERRLRARLLMSAPKWCGSQRVPKGTILGILAQPVGGAGTGWGSTTAMRGVEDEPTAKN
jgi:hypothetical protein